MYDLGRTLEPPLKQGNHRKNSNQAVINNVSISIQDIWNK
jgi:hypothetical protein